MKYKAILFDLDGTLIDTLGDLTYAVNLTLDGYSFPHRTEEQVRSYVGDGARKLIERALPEGADDGLVDKATKEYKKYYLDNILRDTAPYDGIPELLKKLHEEGRKLAVVSNKYDVSTKNLCAHFFHELDLAIGEMEERGIRRKPNPDMVEIALSELNLKREETLYVGDSETDILTAANAGVDCISVTWGFRSREYLESKGAKHIVDSVSDFYSVLAELELDS